MHKDQLSPEFAAQEFERFATAMDLQLDVSDMEDEDRQSFEKQRKIVTDALCAGSLVIRENGEPEFRPTTEDDGADPIVFHEPTGATFLAMDSRKKGQDIAKANAMLGDMTRQPPARFSRMKNRDYKVCQSLLVLFLA